MGSHLEQSSNSRPHLEEGVVCTNKCFLCCKEKESVDHILIHSDKKWVVWHLLFSLFGVSWVLTSSVGETLLSWHGSFMSRKRKKVWQVAHLCLFWTMWKERNNRAFDNEEHLDQGIKVAFLSNLWVWGNLYIPFGPSSIVDFVDLMRSWWGVPLFCYPS